MLGWHISVYKQTDGGKTPATAESPQGARLAVWQAGIGGLDWIVELVNAGRAVNLGGNGYPVRFTAAAEQLTPQFAATPPGARPNWLCGESDLVTEQWEGKTVINGDALGQCRPDEWLIVEAWDES